MATRRRNALAALAAIAFLAGLIAGAGGEDGGSGADSAKAQAEPPPQLPGGDNAAAPSILLPQNAAALLGG